MTNITQFELEDLLDIGAIILTYLVIVCIPVLIVKIKRQSFTSGDFFLWYIYSFWFWIFAFFHAVFFVKSERGCIECPACKELIKEDANMCKYCHTVLEDWHHNHKID